MKTYDIIIAGGGLIGLTAAAALSHNGLKVLVLDAQNKSDFDPQLSPRELRVSALSSDNYCHLKSLGIDQYLNLKRVFPYKMMQVWDNLSSGYIDFNAQPFSGAYLGYIIENMHIQYAAQCRAQELGANIQYGVKIKGFEDKGTYVSVMDEKDNRYKCALLIGADGVRSDIRQQLQIDTLKRDYKQHGIVGYITTSKDMSETALQGFNTEGPIGLLPSGDNQFSFVWSLPENQVERWMTCPQTEFVAGLQKSIGIDLGVIQLDSGLASFPLKKQLAHQYFKGRVVLCGDAAHAIHPMAGQGANLGISDVITLAEELRPEKLKQIEKLTLHLRKYQRRRMSQVNEIATLIDGLHNLFGKQHPFVQWLRGTGMKVTHKLVPLKQWLMKQAGS